MIITQLNITNFRNLSLLKLFPSSRCNVLVGENGSGKTSLLEAIYFFATGRSFRSRLIHPIVAHLADSLVISAFLSRENETALSVGVERGRQGGKTLHINGKATHSLVELTRLMPLQFINHESHSLLEGASKYRRQFLDWGVFHVEHQFYPIWKRLQRVLEQRNAALKARLPLANIVLWDREFVENSLLVSKMRKEYVTELLPVLNLLVTRFLGEFVITFKYYCGWDEKEELTKILQKNFLRECASGFTSVGAHRGDLLILCDDLPAQDVLSRGQQKLLVSALRLAQGLYLKK